MEGTCSAFKELWAQWKQKIHSLTLDLSVEMHLLGSNPVFQTSQYHFLKYAIKVLFQHVLVLWDCHRK